MTEYAVPPPEPTVLPIAGRAAVFPVRRVFCVGRNYGAHVKEMGGDPKEQPPVFFTKPAVAVIPPGAPVPYPSATGKLHHEIELVAALRRGGADIPVEAALDCVFGYAAGVDLTRRDLQDTAKAKGQPWDASKGFDASAPIGALVAMEGQAPPQGAIRLSVNGETRQAARLSDMIWSVGEIVSQLSKLWRLEAGDLIFTGTPEGVGPLVRGDRVEGEIEHIGQVAFEVA